MSCLTLQQSAEAKPLKGVSASWLWLAPLCEPAQETMDRDRKLFEEVKNGMRGPTLRFYRWAEPALSYGRVQGLGETASAEDGLPRVKRPTGGGKVRHGEDLCFSLFWSRGHSEIPWKVPESYCAIHGWIKEALEELGYAARQVPSKEPDGNGWCFQSAVQSDLVLSGRKIVGGAQWRDGNAALHQGSIQLPVGLDRLQAFKAAFARRFNAEFKPC